MVFPSVLVEVSWSKHAHFLAACAQVRTVFNWSLAWKHECEELEQQGEGGIAMSAVQVTVVIGMASQHPYMQPFSEEAPLNIKYLKLNYRMPCLFSPVKLKLKMISESFSCPSLNLS